MSNDPIKHVVVLMFENRSFDEMLGALKAVYPELDGVDPARPGVNLDSSGREYRQTASVELVVDPDPKHELDNISRQLNGGNAGFVRDYEEAYPGTSVEERQRIMSYFPLDSLPALHVLAREFAVCDRWYASVPGPTWTNRLFVHSGTSLGIVHMPTGVGDAGQFVKYRQDTLYDRLNERGISWRVYHGDIPQSLLLNHQWTWSNLRRYDLMQSFFDAAEGDAEDFPEFAFIEPCYMRGEANDDHPPHGTMAAQQLLASVYNAIRANEELWKSTLLVVTYDEHGGFYDHVSPPAVVPPDDHHDEFAFDRLGVRVPAVLISPWVERGVVHEEFDHTSIIRYVSDRWGLRELTRRSAEANSIGVAVRTTGQPRTDTPARIDMPYLAAASIVAGEPEEARNDHQRALLEFSKFLEEQAGGVGAPIVAVPEAGVATDAEIARQRVEAFKRRMGAVGGGDSEG